jgi:hypothetical protein
MRTRIFVMILFVTMHVPSMAGPLPQTALEELLAADRSFAAEAAKRDLVSGITLMLDADAILPAPGAVFARGPGGAMTLLRTNPRNLGATATWSPVRGVISADGTRGLTFGFMSIRRSDGARETAKYLSYWVRRPAGWRVLAYHRTRREGTELPDGMMPPLLPGQMVTPRRDPAAMARHQASLAAAEAAFSDLAQRIGLGPAFGEVGTKDSVLISVGKDFVTGSRNIAQQGFGPETTSSVSWSSDATDVASSGDLGLSYGVVRPNAGTAGEPFAYFTVWRRNSTSEGWRFLAE